ncbi:Major facilitator superfamily [Macrophomina phaseolina MS6]|uniref:MFS-type transporper mpsC n=1 Tax=Macrophomina phaseolina (strain MS6) TaxID=1126212 RepID=MPSC_MACPH|nr:RecName: Full=MFS-type transporper mpsC; AltName: Full=Macrophasetins biosynthesis cluster protein C [Macrophomina phaseolina MS6]EKG15179.1 Major facilitator superfamily [Macrophomina phaseolina MS6]
MTSSTESKHSNDESTDLEKQDAEESHGLPEERKQDIAAQLSSSDVQDPNLVDWDGPDDPANPMNWPKSKRLGHVVMASLTTLFANITSTAFAPAASSLEAEFGITSSITAALTVSIYLLGFAFGPLVIAPLSEHFGRLPVYRVCTVITVAFLIGCAQAKNLGMFLVFRLITGIAGSGPGTIGGGTIADVMAPENRGKAMGAFAMGPLMGPVLGPLMSGFIAQYLDWRWVFRVLCIATGVMTIVLYFVMTETYGPVLLKRKAARLRKETGNPDLHTKLEASGVSPLASLWMALQRPTKMLIFSPITLLLSLYCAFVFGLLILLFTTFSAVYRQQYGFNVSMGGLSYLGLGFGLAIGLVLFGMLSDKVAKKDSARSSEWKPEARLLLMVWFAPVIPGGFFWYGWTAYYKVHWILPMMGTSLIGMGALMVMMPIQVYLVDAFGPRVAASALAANTLLRSLAGCFLPLAGPSLYEALGLGWGNTLLGFIAIGFTCLPILFYRFGGKLRLRFPVTF